MRAAYPNQGSEATVFEVLPFASIALRFPTFYDLTFMTTPEDHYIYPHFIGEKIKALDG